ncbi:Mesogenin-1, partial [Frankliniella fusca]
MEASVLEERVRLARSQAVRRRRRARVLPRKSFLNLRWKSSAKWVTRRLSKSSPPRWVSPAVDLTSKSAPSSMEGVVRLPWSLAMISTLPCCHTPTHEYVVPRSMPTAGALFPGMVVAVWVCSGRGPRAAPPVAATDTKHAHDIAYT